MKYINLLITENSHWTDTLGKPRSGAEPEARRNLRLALQQSASDAEFYLYRNLLQKFDREWISQTMTERSGL
jgi:hypothetical protein